MRTLWLGLSAGMMICVCSPLRADDWPQWRGPRRDGVWRETGIVEKFGTAELKPRWRVPVSGGYSGPTVADRRVYLTDRLAEPEQKERVLCFRFDDGRLLWSFEYPCLYTISYRAGPRASVTVDEGRAYALGSMGHLHCLEAASGRLLWSKIPGKDWDVEVPTWGVAAAPLVEKDLLIVQIGARPGACVAAFDKRTGAERWAALNDPASYSAPVCIDQAGRRVVVCWTGTRVVGLDAQSGRLLWAKEYGYDRWVIAIATPVVQGDRLLVTACDRGAMMLRLLEDRPAAELLWWRHGSYDQPDDGLHALMCTPLLAGDYLYGVSAYGVLRCLDARQGERIWEDTTVTSQVRWGNAHLVQNGERTWIFNDQGELIIARLAPGGYEEIDRARLLRPTRGQLSRGEGVTWSHPAFAQRHVLNRNDEELVCVSLAAEE